MPRNQIALTLAALTASILTLTACHIDHADATTPPPCEDKTVVHADGTPAVQHPELPACDTAPNTAAAEDDPTQTWNCATQGNHVCGPGVPATVPEDCFGAPADHYAPGTTPGSTIYLQSPDELCGD